MGVSEIRTERLRRALEQAYAAGGEVVAIPTPELAYATGLSAGTTLKLLKRMELDRMCFSVIARRNGRVTRFWRPLGLPT